MKGKVINKIKNTILYPWLSIWIYPKKTLRYILRFQNITTLFLLYSLTIFSSLDSVNEERLKVWSIYSNITIPMGMGIIEFLLDIFSLYIVSWIFKEKNFKKSTIIVLLTSIPFYMYKIILWFGLWELEYNESIVITFSVLYILWLPIISFILIREAFKFSKMKTFIVMLLSMLLSTLAYFIVLYFENLILL